MIHVIGNNTICGQHSNSAMRWLTMMNQAVRDIEGYLGPEQQDTFLSDLHKVLKADYALANPPFNDLDSHRSDEHVRWKYDLSLNGNAKFTWVEQFVQRLPPKLELSTKC